MAFVERGEDQVLKALASNSLEITQAELGRGDLISWHMKQRLNFGLGHGTQDYSFTSHAGVSRGGNQVFSKLGIGGPYTILDLGNPILTVYESTRFWRLGR